MDVTILLVDVDSANREELKSFLHDQKCNVITATDCESAVRCCLILQPDLVLLYDNLPDIDSFELCRQLKREPFNELIPVVLVRPSLDQSNTFRGWEAGAMDIWVPPSSLWD